MTENDTAELNALRERYRQLINEELPAAIQSPVRFNHCFARIVLDGLFQDVWYDHIATRPAYRALSVEQLHRAIERMELWLVDRSVLVNDNRASLRYRNKVVD